MCLWLLVHLKTASLFVVAVNLLHMSVWQHIKNKEIVIKSFQLAKLVSIFFPQPEPTIVVPLTKSKVMRTYILYFNDSPVSYCAAGYCGLLLHALVPLCCRY